MPDNASSHNPRKRHPPELKLRVSRLVFQSIERRSHAPASGESQVKVGLHLESWRNTAACYEHDERSS
jgi:hypothetical protein